MALVTRPGTINDRLRETYPPVPAMDGTFSGALRRLADRLDNLHAGGHHAVRQASRDGLTADNCLAMIEVIATVAATEGVTITAATSERTDDGMEVRFTLEGEASVVEGLAAMIERSDRR